MRDYNAIDIFSNPMSVEDMQDALLGPQTDISQYIQPDDRDLLDKTVEGYEEVVPLPAQIAAGFTPPGMAMDIAAAGKYGRDSFADFSQGNIGSGFGNLGIAALSGLAAVPLVGELANLAKQPLKKGIASLDEDMLDLKKILDDPKLSNANKLEQAENHPAVVKAVEQMDQIPLTRDIPGYGSPEFMAQRQFMSGDKTLVGYDQAADELYQGGRALAYREQGLDIPKNVMDKNTGEKVATIVIGPPAAGKSAISNPLAIKTRATIIDSDEAKKLLPEFQGGIGANAVHHESKVISNKVLDYAVERGDNLVLPRVGANPDSIRMLSSGLKNNGYRVNLVLTEIDPDLALIRMNDRFIRKGRLINPTYAKNIKDSPIKTYNKLKQEGIADGYGKIDTTTRIGEPKQIFEDTADIFTETGL